MQSIQHAYFHLGENQDMHLQSHPETTRPKNALARVKSNTDPVHQSFVRLSKSMLSMPYLQSMLYF